MISILIWSGISRADCFDDKWLLYLFLIIFFKGGYSEIWYIQCCGLLIKCLFLLQYLLILDLVILFLGGDILDLELVHLISIFLYSVIFVAEFSDKINSWVFIQLSGCPGAYSELLYIQCFGYGNKIMWILHCVLILELVWIYLEGNSLDLELVHLISILSWSGIFEAGFFNDIIMLNFGLDVFFSGNGYWYLIHIQCCWLGNKCFWVLQYLLILDLVFLFKKWKVLL